MRYLVLYQSMSGFTKKYAEWIVEDLNAEIYPLKKFRMNTLSHFDAIVFGGSLHAVGISGLSALKKYYEILKDKPLFIFATGASPEQDHIPDEVMNKNFNDEQKQHIRFFYFRGGFNLKKLNWASKILMTLLKWKILLKKKSDRNSDEKGMLSAMAHPVDFTRRENISFLVREIKNCQMKK